MRFNIFAEYREGGDYEAGDGSEIPGDYRSTDTRWSVGFKLGERGRLDYSGGYQEQRDLDYPGRLLDATYFYTRSQSLAFESSPRDSVRLSGRVYLNFKDHLMNNDEKPTAQPDPNRIPPFPIEVDLPAESNTWGAQFQAELDRGPLHWTLGTDFYHLNQNASRTVSRRDTGMVMFTDIVWPDAVIEDLGVFAQLTHARGSMRLGGTLRLDFVEAGAGAVSDFFLMNTTGSLDQSETNVSAAFSADFDLSPHWAIERRSGTGGADRVGSRALLGPVSIDQVPDFGGVHGCPRNTSPSRRWSWTSA